MDTKRFKNSFIMEKKRITRSNIGNHLFDYQLKIVGKKRIDIIDDDRWRFNITMTRNQYNEFRVYAIKLLMKTFKFRKEKAIRSFDWFIEMFGLRIKG